ncbi:hypothetical protein AgCh_028149 [Apium graveolens]
MPGGGRNRVEQNLFTFHTLLDGFYEKPADPKKSDANTDLDVKVKNDDAGGVPRQSQSLEAATRSYLKWWRVICEILPFPGGAKMTAVGNFVSGFKLYLSKLSNQDMIVEEIDPATAGPTQVKEQTAEIAADPKSHGEQEPLKQSTLKPKCLFPLPEGASPEQSLNLTNADQRQKKRKFKSDQ